MFDRVRDQFRNDVPGRHLNPFRQAAAGLNLEVDGDRRAASKRAERRGKPTLGEDRGVDASGGLAQLFQRPIYCIRSML